MKKMRRVKLIFSYIEKRCVVAGHAASYLIELCPEEYLADFIRWEQLLSLDDTADSVCRTAEADV